MSYSQKQRRSISYLFLLASNLDFTPHFLTIHFLQASYWDEGLFCFWVFIFLSIFCMACGAQGIDSWIHLLPKLGLRAEMSASFHVIEQHRQCSLCFWCLGVRVLCIGMRVELKNSHFLPVSVGFVRSELFNLLTSPCSILRSTTSSSLFQDLLLFLVLPEMKINGLYIFCSLNGAFVSTIHTIGYSWRSLKTHLPSFMQR